MIKYSLRCAACEYKFPGWFRNSDTYDEQLAANAISCPSCGDNDVGKALTTPYVKRSRSTQSTSGGDGSSAASVALLRQASEAARTREMMLDCAAMSSLDARMSALVSSRKHARCTKAARKSEISTVKRIPAK